MKQHKIGKKQAGPSNKSQSYDISGKSAASVVCGVSSNKNLQIAHNKPKVISYNKGHKANGFTHYGGKFGTFPLCHSSHPTLEYGKGVVRGGNCQNYVQGFDIYIGLDSYSHSTQMHYPWNPSENKVIDILYPIVDYSVPRDAEDFKRMIEWLSDQLNTGKRVHIGCIGGHGRTGLVMSALRAYMYDDINASAWVRQHYCKKAVESNEQNDFLKKHFSVEPVEILYADFGFGAVDGYSNTKNSAKNAYSSFGNSTFIDAIDGQSIWRY